MDENTERPVWIEALKQVAIDFEKMGHGGCAEYLKEVSQKTVELLEHGDVMKARPHYSQDNPNASWNLPK